MQVDPFNFLSALAIEVCASGGNSSERASWVGLSPVQLELSLSTSFVPNI